MREDAEHFNALATPCFEVTRATTPPSGVSVRIESRRTRFNCGAVRFLQHTESKSLFESVSISMKGGWKETRGVQRPISAETSVSESRMVLLNPFETKRKKAPKGPHLGFAMCKWRIDRDSNPRDGSPPTHFPGVRLRPLGHRSVGGCLAGSSGALKGGGGRNSRRTNLAKLAYQLLISTGLG